MEVFYADAPDTPTTLPKPIPKRLRDGLQMLLQSIYPDADQSMLLDQTVAAFWPDEEQPKRRGRAPANTLWNEQDLSLIHI